MGGCLIDDPGARGPCSLRPSMEDTRFRGVCESGLMVAVPRQTTRAIRGREAEGSMTLRIAQAPVALRPRQDDSRLTTSTVKDALRAIHGEVDYCPISM